MGLCEAVSEPENHPIGLDAVMKKIRDRRESVQASAHCASSIRLGDRNHYGVPDIISVQGDKEVTISLDKTQFRLFARMIFDAVGDNIQSVPKQST